MKTKPFRLGMVGCGDIAAYVAVLTRTIPGLTISTCCAARLEESRAFARKHHIKDAEPDYDTLLSNHNFDGIYLAIPHHLHLPFLSQALERDIPVLCEKPVAVDIHQAKEMIRLTELHRVKVGINYQYRYDRYCWQLRQEIMEGNFGEIFHIRINVPWNRKENYFDRAVWHKQISTAGGGTLLTQGSHFLDIALWCLTTHPVIAFGKTAHRKFVVPDIEVEDLAMGIIEMENGTMIEICSTMTAEPERRASIEVYGEKGTIIYHAGRFPGIQHFGKKTKVKSLPLPAHGIHPLARSLQAFRFWIQSNQEYLTPIQSAYPVMAVIDAIYRSAQSGKREKINLF